MQGFPVSHSFCGTWNPVGETNGTTRPPVENAVETGTRTFSCFKISNRLTSGSNSLTARNLLNMQDLFLFITSSQC